MKGLAKIFIRIFSVSLMLQGIGTLPYCISAMSMDASSVIYPANIHMAFEIIAAVLLWTFAEKIAGYITKGDENAVIAVSVEKMQIAAFSVVGIVILINTIPVLISNILSMFAYAQRTSDMAVKNQIDAVTNIIKGLLGVYLVIGASGIAKQIKRFINERIDSIRDDDFLLIDQRAQEKKDR